MSVGGPSFLFGRESSPRPAGGPAEALLLKSGMAARSGGGAAAEARFISISKTGRPRAMANHAGVRAERGGKNPGGHRKRARRCRGARTLSRPPTTDSEDAPWQAR